MICLSLPLPLQTSAFVPELQKLSRSQSAKISGEVTSAKMGRKTKRSKKTCVIEQGTDTEDESDSGNDSDSEGKKVKGKSNRRKDESSKSHAKKKRKKTLK